MHVTQRVDPFVFREIRRGGGALARRHTGVHLHEHAAVIEAHGRTVRPHEQPLADKLRGQRVQRLGHLRVLIAGHLRLSLQWDIVWCRWRRQQLLPFFGLKVLAWQALRGGVSAQAVVFQTPPTCVSTCRLHRVQSFAAEAVLAYGRHTALDARFVLRSSHAGGVNVEVPCLGVFQEHAIDQWLQGIGPLDDRLRIVWE